MVIDVILVIIIGVISFIAAYLLPSKAMIENNDTAKYKSSKPFIYAVGCAALIIGILLIMLFAMDEEYQQLINIPKMGILLLIGITLISANIKKSKLIAKHESTVVTIAPGATDEVTAEVVTAEAVAQPAVQPQAEVQVQVQATPAVQAQTQAEASKPKAAQAAKPKSKIVVIKCPKCKGDMQIDTGMMGQKMKCPHCGVEGKIG